MGSAASVEDAGEIISKERAKDLAGKDWDEDEWGRCVTADSGTITGADWNIYVRLFVKHGCMWSWSK